MKSLTVKLFAVNSVALVCKKFNNYNVGVSYKSTGFENRRTRTAATLRI